VLTVVATHRGSRLEFGTVRGRCQRGALGYRGGHGGGGGPMVGGDAVGRRGSRDAALIVCGRWHGGAARRRGNDINSGWTTGGD
jgi:hypothetical protein